ncbi:hypothetical protein [Streptomyces sp. Da 82-17]|uniref:hypothetical protein n=1 Tax=Streptomyces sp. Da 82-17 TaxID=3377116 RepID=UPI0038D3B5F5
MEDKADTGKSGANEDKSKRKKIDLNVPQVAGSAVAAVVAAKLASSFGVYGTILGAGLVSVIATCGGSVFQHFFSRTGEQVREVAEKAKPRARQVPVTADGRPVPATFRAAAPPAGPGVTGATTGPVTTSWRPGVVTPEADATTVLPATADADADRTRLLTSVSPAGADRTRLLAPVGAADADRTQLLTEADPEGTQLLTPVRRPDAEATTLLPRADATMLLRANAPAADAPAAPDDETRLLDTAPAPVSDLDPVPVQGRRIKSWKRPLLGAALIFGVTMAGISTYELVSGNSFSGNDSQVLRPSSWGGSSADGTEESTPDERPAESTPGDGGSTGSGEQAPATGPATTPGGDSRGTAPAPAPSTTQPDGGDPTPEPSPSRTDADPTPEPTTPQPTDGATDTPEGQDASPAE